MSGRVGMSEGQHCTQICVVVTVYSFQRQVRGLCLSVPDILSCSVCFNLKTNAVWYELLF